MIIHRQHLASENRIFYYDTINMTTKMPVIIKFAYTNFAINI